MKNWQQILDKIVGVKILLIGDIMLDCYFWKSVEPSSAVKVLNEVSGDKLAA